MSETKKKTSAKATGLKSAIRKEDVLYLSSFGKGPKATLEKVIIDEKVENIEIPENFNAAVEQEGIHIEKNKKLKTTIDNPLVGKIRANHGLDQLRLKDKLEQTFYGTTFDDNLHIQIIYNILDIKKIIAPFINEIVFSINNLQRYSKDVGKKELHDFVGTLRWTITHEHFSTSSDEITADYYKKFQDFVTKIMPGMAYYPEVFNPRQEKDGNSVKLFTNEKDVHTILRIINATRQDVFHANINFLYNVDTLKERRTSGINDIRALLDRFYTDKVHAVNKQFITHNNKTNFTIINDILNVTSREEKVAIARKYYRFIVMGEGKNLGFSIKKLREALLTSADFKYITDQKFDNVRGKLYTLFNFLIFDTFTKDAAGEKWTNELITKLRENLTVEGKENIYRGAAEALANNTDFVLITKKLTAKMNPKMLTKQNYRKITKEEQELVQTVFNDDEATYFAKLIYFLTLFLDGKESNELLSSLINKFENINSFIELNEAINKQAKTEAKGQFSSQYKIFNNARLIAEELRFIKNIARTNLEIVTTRVTFAEAAIVLGLPAFNLHNKEELEKFADKIHERDKALRNFLINNVLKSRRYRYLIKRVSPQQIQQFNNKNVFTFILKQMPEAQIDRHYTALTSHELKGETNYKIRKITDILMNSSFAEFANVTTNMRKATHAQRKDAVLKKAIVGLYLTIVYNLYKNLNNINARYVMAYHIHERDSSFYDIKLGTATRDQTVYLALTKLFIEQECITKKWRFIAMKNIKDLDEYSLLTSQRNKVMHLNIIGGLHRYINHVKHVKSYFAIYHFVLQSYLLSDLKRPAKKFQLIKDRTIIKLLQKTVDIGVYTKDAIHILNTPFAYNTARYKNLSTEALFDKNESKLNATKT